MPPGRQGEAHGYVRRYLPTHSCSPQGRQEQVRLCRPVVYAKADMTGGTVTSNAEQIEDAVQESRRQLPREVCRHGTVTSNREEGEDAVQESRRQLPREVCRHM